MNEVLLDTHTLLWALTNLDRLSPRVRKLIETDAKVLYLSTASLWEIVIKTSLKKLVLSVPLSDLVQEATQVLGVRIVAVDIPHLEKLLELPFRHRDPFDRLLVATALTLNCPIISRDKDFDRYPVKRVWN